MPRQPGLWRRAQDGFWYTTIKRKKIRLAADKAEARKALYELLAKPEAAPPVSSRLSVRKLADQYLAYIERTAAKTSFDNYLLYLKSFCDHLGAKAVSDLRVEHVTAWEAANSHWAHSTVVTVRAIVIGCLNWGVEQGVIEQNPIPRLKAGKTSRRERLLTAAELDKVRAAVPQAMKDFLQALELTGARPFGEVAKLTAASIDWANGIIPLAIHKNARKGKSRTIFLTPPLEALLRRKCEERPTGLLFLSPRKAPFTRHLMSWWLRRLEEKTGVPRLNTYLVRHAAITTALENGVSSDVAAELYGNSSETISRYYSHLSEKRNALKAAAAKALG
ncbi:MAG TPA: tyrosine-type recombinase/integrase [Urbifossiella sp.]|jgi:integrase|nr:tyrosine-type recombinase/integrase [Urbifossiella sp.]